MFGTIIVSICGVALPIATGMWLAPGKEVREQAEAGNGELLAETVNAMTRARRRLSWAETVRQERFHAGVAPSSAGGFGGNLASGS
jgi:hypothetical protein